jgi:hypothetical protein
MPIILRRLWLGSSLAVTLDTGAEGSVGRLSAGHGRVMQGYSHDQFFSTLRAFHGENDAIYGILYGITIKYMEIYGK